MPLISFTAGTTIVSDSVDANFALCVLTDTAKTITVTHTWSASQTFAGWTSSAGVTVSSGTSAFQAVTCTTLVASSTASWTGGTFTLDVKSVTAFTTPSALSATQFTAFASTVSGATLMGFGTTHDVSLKNRAGTTAIGVTANTVNVTCAGDVDFVTILRSTTTNGGSVLSATALQCYASTTLGGVVSGFGTTNDVTIANRAGTTVIGVVANSTAVTLAGTTYINDSANAKATLGLTINQGAADDEALSLKSSDIAHGVTDESETDTFLNIKKYSGTDGGAIIQALSEGSVAFYGAGSITTATSLRSTSATGAIQLVGSLKSGTGLASLGGDKNILVIADYTTSRYVFDTDGSAHADVEWIAF